MSENLRTSPEDARVMRRAAYASTSVAAFLAFVKLIVWIMTGSVAMLGSLVDSALDMLSSVINLIAVKVSLLPPDEEHRYGHGKAEPIAGLLQASIILGSATFLTMESVSRLLNPVEISAQTLGIAVSVVAIFLTIFLVIYQKRVVRQTQSITIDADSLHYTGDLLLNVAVIAALLITQYTSYNFADGVFGIAIALYIGRSAILIFKDSIDMLMDKEFPDEEREKIFNLAMTSPGVRAVHDIKTRRSGRHAFIQMHVEVDSVMPLSKAHMIGLEVETTVGEAFPGTEIMIHMDPAGQEPPAHRNKEKEI